jgi:WhiB family transcriptional regulator, redox-sensing transcriptional regulator
MSGAEVLGPRQAAVLEHLAEHPGLTAGELERFFGLKHSLLPTLRKLEQAARVVAVTAHEPSQGKPVSRWSVAPPGTVPPPVAPADPVQAARVRERDRESLRARRSRRAAGARIVRRASLPDFTGAACRTADPELFFGSDAERMTDRQCRAAQAKAICAGCPIRAACLAWALDTGQAFGIWGGADEDERGAMLRQAARRAS